MAGMINSFAQCELFRVIRFLLEKGIVLHHSISRPYEANFMTAGAVREILKAFELMFMMKVDKNSSLLVVETLLSELTKPFGLTSDEKEVTYPFLELK
ncbi:hypothetical protein AVEN_115659-1, partial [Araneus ventricosus]